MSTAVDYTELRELIAETLELPVEEVTDDAHFVEDLEVDSLMALEIVVQLEKRYGVKMDETELANVTSLARVRELLEQKLA